MSWLSNPDALAAFVLTAVVGGFIIARLMDG